MEEIALINQIDQDLTISVEEVVAELTASEKVEQVKVYDAAGSVVSEFAGDIDFTQIPADAELIMTEGTTQYYMVLN